MDERCPAWGEKVHWMWRDTAMIRMKMQMHILAVCSGRSHPFSQGKKVNRVLQRTTKLNELYLRNESAEAVRVNLKLAKPNRGGHDILIYLPER